MTDSGRRRGRPSTGVREAVLAATEEILAEAGVARLSTKEIARRAGVAESSIFYHFTDRLGLLQAVVALHLPRFKDVAEGLRAGEGELRGNLVALVEALEAFYTRIAPILAAVQSDAELRARFATRGAGEVIGPRRGVAPIAAYFAAEREAGRLRADLDVESAALLVMGAAHQRAVFAGLGGPVPGAVGEIVDVLIPGLTAG
ncbi:TetR/AcrR family transcriptional regulator [Phytomonospora sp. NPDC050363]|uniref:TetR/AcrR family transcriptional regulator n=1 Tax=Phytomonospora sp. NPDC050363 TaxID=3155642 RepID=UPI0033DD4BFE